MKIERRYEIERAAGGGVSRPHLNHAYYEPEKRRMIATNGHIAVVVPVIPDVGDTAGPVSAEALKAARKAAPRGEEFAGLAANGSLAVPGGVTFPRPPDLKLPSVDAVIPEYKAGDAGTLTIGLDAQLLLDLARAVGAFEKESKDTTAATVVYLTVKLPKPGKPIIDPILVANRKPNGEIGLLMPVRP